MSKRILVLVLSLFLLFTTGCEIQKNLEITDNIMAPENLNPPINGKWTIESYKMLDSSKITEEAASTYLGRDVIFHKDLVAVGSDYTTTPTYKIKNVKAVDYLIYNYKVNAKLLGIENEYIQVVSITGEEQFFYEFIKISDERVIVNIDGVFFTLRKVTEKINQDLINEYYLQDKDLYSLDSDKINKNIIDKTGILIGLKSYDKDSTVEDWEYRTLFLRFRNKELVSSYEKEDIFLPRKNGFWLVGVDRFEVDKKLADNIYVEPIQKKVRSSRGEASNYDLSLKNILYLNSNYISIEKVDEKRRKLEFYPLDSINKGKPIKISDVIGEKGEAAFIEGMYKDILLKENLKDIKVSDLDLDEYNFGIFRRNGHWTLKGRVDLQGINEDGYKDFYINALLPEEIVSYDELNLPWSEVKTNIAEAVDVFVSPNNDIVIIQTYSQLLLYTYINGDISKEPIAKIRLKPNEKVIMKEWSLGKYPSTWEEEFLKTDFKILEYD